MVGEGITYPSACALEAAQNKATEVSRHLEVLAEDLIIHHQVFCLRAAGDIVEQFPEKENKCKAIVIALCLPNGKCSGVDNYLSGQKSPTVWFPIYRLQGKIFGYLILGIKRLEPELHPG